MMMMMLGDVDDCFCGVSRKTPRLRRSLRAKVGSTCASQGLGVFAAITHSVPP